MSPDDKRQEMLERRSTLPESLVRESSSTVLSLLEGLPEFREAELIAAYVGIRGEIDPSALVGSCGKRVALPVILPDGELEFMLAAGPMASGPFGTSQPEGGDVVQAADLDLALVPLVLADVSGNRIGHGRGYYDRAFSSRLTGPAPPVLVGLAHGFQVVPTIEPRPWDVRLDIVLTDEGILRPEPPIGED
ncbi:MAG: 5-formyltetrahydrofolate cyclo-ligase [Acidimicrobiia bacterium]|nr:5-formyltetrahydrofolate cyclo-ligase [Actinomycetota bacterium]MBL6923917.1 5-formyltetrahydrofolate cyclo-ligase [Acidimicrobiia bacterium]MBL6927524.1 5-formyltetrahydrofolate cyclo-ligase [Acidimicrobiia bacterium]